MPHFAQMMQTLQQNPSLMQGLQGMQGLGAPPPVTNPEETYSSQLSQLQVCLPLCILQPTHQF